MDVELYRDWIIIIYLGIGSVALLVVLTFFIIVAVKLINIVTTMTNTVENVHHTSSVISDSVIAPLAQARGFFSGIRKGMEVIFSLTRMEGDKDVKR